MLGDNPSAPRVALLCPLPWDTGATAPSLGLNPLQHLNLKPTDSLLWIFFRAARAAVMRQIKIVAAIIKVCLSLLGGFGLYGLRVVIAL